MEELTISEVARRSGVRATTIRYYATRDGDFEAVIAVLDPDVVLRSDGGSYIRAPRWWFAVREPWPSRRSPAHGSC